MDLKIRTREDMIAAAIVQLGLVPRDSVVLMVTKAAGRTFTARLDMPTLDEVDELVTILQGGACEREGVVEAALLLFTDSADVADVADRITDRLPRIAFVEALHVTRDWYTSLSTPDGVQHPYDLTAHQWVAEAVAEGHLVLQDEQDIYLSLDGSEPSAELVASFEHHADRWRAVKDETALGWHNRDEALFVKDTLATLLHGGTIDDTAVGRLAAALVPLAVRDVAWAVITHDNARRYMEVFRDLTRRMPPPLNAAPAALFGFAAWLAGDGVSARIGMERALDAEPGYGMALLLRQALAVGMNPARWEPLEETELPVWNVA